MACSLQRLFTVGEEFEDEEFLLAVESTEAISSSTSTAGAGLRPIGSSLRTLVGSHNSSPPLVNTKEQQKSDPVLTENDKSPVLGLQSLRNTLTKVRLPSYSTSQQQNNFRTVENANTKFPVVDLQNPIQSVVSSAVTPGRPMVNSKNVSCWQAPSCASKFKFVRKDKEVSCTTAASNKISSKESDDDLFLSAFEEFNDTGITGDQDRNPAKNSRQETCQASSLELGSVNPQIRPRAGFMCDKLEVKKPRVECSTKFVTNAGNLDLQNCNEQVNKTGSNPPSSERMHCINSSFKQSKFDVLNMETSRVDRQMLSPHQKSSSLVPSIQVASVALTPQASTVKTNEVPSCRATSFMPPSSSASFSLNSCNGDFIPNRLSLSSPQPRDARHWSFSAEGNLNPRLSKPQIPVQSYLTPKVPSGRIAHPTRSPVGTRVLASTEHHSSTTRPLHLSVNTPNSLQTPVVTNHLVQLVSAANQTPQSASLSVQRMNTRRFPGPAGILPEQHSARNLDEIIISAPQTPSHGAQAKVHTQEFRSSQQSVDDDFGKGPWAVMKAELGLNQKDPSCFLYAYSIAMVLRKAALKQLPKNKVPNMAVVIKSVTRTNADASAVFKDPTGVMQGTVHRHLLEEQQSELKDGSVLLLKQVGVFSPSHRNHYLNVTPNNLVKVYSPDIYDRSYASPSQSRGMIWTGSWENCRKNLSLLPDIFFSSTEECRSAIAAKRLNSVLYNTI
ncbi:homologous recombination OB-fold protein isoform X2 [Latimeria chalumnae]|uniref:homologous recombination OB-fold protein isoform X2 n=1 Tax=Latimeria chalumnae TaxID=7897 RepID=UPI0003C139D5|nr:PREDICTED: uncharacterized protein C17orf53 homolog isoform X2 [Latimeria chalumnae]|eukprot:XP_005992265.1 PREDICTED: uncharacterized protein C17orf53 homolog isoform X2 [Latimeria chalumnae]